MKLFRVFRGQNRGGKPHPGIHSKGSVLVISLIFLLVLTLISLVGVEAGLLEEKMNANLRDHDLAFQAAESALKAGETMLKQQNPVFQYASNGDPGLYLSSSNIELNGKNYTLQAAYQTDDFWKNSAYFISCTLCALAAGANKPEFVMEQLPQTLEAGTSLETGVASNDKFYRITAHGFGANIDASVTLQTVFKQ